MPVAGNRIPFPEYAGCCVRGRGAVLLTLFATSIGGSAGVNDVMVSEDVTTNVRYTVSAVNKTAITNVRASSSSGAGDGLSSRRLKCAILWPRGPIRRTSEGCVDVNIGGSHVVVLVDCRHQHREHIIDDGLVHSVDTLFHERWGGYRVDLGGIAVRAKSSSQRDHVSVRGSEGARVLTLTGAVVGPVVGTMRASVFRIVRAEHDDENVPLVAGQGLVLRSLPIGGVGAFHHGAATCAQVRHFVFIWVTLIEHDLELTWVGVVPARRVYTSGDGVANTAYSNLIIRILFVLLAH